MIIDVRYAGYDRELDEKIERIVGRESVSAGFYIPTGDRDMQFDLEPEIITETIDRLRAHGITAERRGPRAARETVT